MISRVFTLSGRNSVQQTFRCLRVSAVRLGGHDHHEPVPVHIPRPAVQSKGFWGDGPAPIHPPTPYKPSKDCYTSYFGAGLFVALTCLAITFYTDLLGMNMKKGQHFHDKSHDHGHSNAEIKHVLEKKVVIAPKEVVEKPVPCCEAEKCKDKPNAAEVISEKTAPRETLFTVATDNHEQTGKKSDCSHAVHKSEPAADHATDHQEPPKEHEDPAVTPDSKNPRAEEVLTKKEGPKHEVQPPAVLSDSKIPQYVEYLLIGAGAAAYYAALAIRARDADAKVLMIGEERELPYQRPPLSKELWWYGDKDSKDTLEYKALTGKKRDVFFEAQGFFVPPGQLTATAHGGVSLVNGKKVVKVCAEEKKAFLEDGTEIKFDKCLVATGGQPRRLEQLDKKEIQSKVLYLRGIEDYRKLESLCKDSKSVTVVGGGFLGSELSYSIKRKYGDLKVTQVVAEKGNLATILPEYLSKKATESVKAIGVDVLTNAKISGAKDIEGKIEIQLDDKKKISSDFVVVAIGTEPNTKVAEESGFEIDTENGGVLASAELRVSPDIYTAGDVCSFMDKTFGRRRVEHWENAQISGRLAGENMTGGNKAFWYQPSYFTKISPDHHINAVGNTDAVLPTVSVFAENDDPKKTYDRGVVFYKGVNNQVVGVLLVNVFGPSIDVARRLIEEAKPIEDYRELAKLFPLFELEKEEKAKET